MILSTSFHRSTAFRWAMFVACAMALGFFLSADQIINIDDHTDLSHGEWLLWRYGAGSPVNIDGLSNIALYGPLFDLVVAILSKTLFAFLHNPFWVQRATSFAVFLMSVTVAARLLRLGGIAWSTIALSLALLLGNIRLGGHALLNQKDIPFACGFLLATLALWHIVHRFERTKLISVRMVATATLVCLVPFLLRPVPPLHLSLLYAYCAYTSVRRLKKGQFKQAVTMLALPPALTAAVVFAAFPVLWETPLSQWKEPFTIFLSYPWSGFVRAFGRSFSVPGDPLPWWYVFSWFPVMMHPVALCALIVGLAGSLWHVFRPTERLTSFSLPLGFGKHTPSITLERWLWIVIALSWTAFFVLRPNVYDEERHMIFLYLPVLVTAGLGLGFLHRRAQTATCTVIIVFALTSYVQWGRYSYVYQSPLVTNGAEDQFMGDYWGTCMAKAIQTLPTVVPPGTTISYAWLDKSGPRFATTMSTGLPFTQPALAMYPHQERGKGGHAYLNINRMETFDSMTHDVSNGVASIVWQDRMPPNDNVSCLILYYPPTKNDSH